MTLIFARAAFAAQAKTEKTPAVDCSKVDDATLTANVKDKLAKAPSLKDAAVNVETKGGVVTLTGTVKNASIKGVATRMAKGVACVKSVDNELAIEKGAAPAKAKSRIENVDPCSAAEQRKLLQDANEWLRLRDDLTDVLCWNVKPAQGMEKLGAVVCLNCQQQPT